MTDAHEVVVIGGGFGGLFAAAELHNRGRDVVLVEAGDSPGGVATTLVEDGYRLETAAGTLLLPHRALTPILERTGVATAPAAEVAAVRYLWTRGRLAAVPTSPQAVLTPAISWRGKLRMAAEPLVRTRPPEGEESLRGLLTRRLGSEAGTLLSHVAASGVYAGDAGTMSAAAAFPAIAELERSAGSIVRGGLRRLRSVPKPRPPRPRSHVPVGGMSTVATTLGASLGDRVRLGSRITRVAPDGDTFVIEGPEMLRARSVVVALAPAAAARVMPGIDTDALDGWPTSPVAVVGIGGPTTDVPLPDGFGYLAGPDVDAVGLGCLFESSYAPDRAPSGHSLAKVIAGGARRHEVVEWDDERIVTTVVGEMERAFGRPVRPGWTRVIRHAPGIPHYDLDHRGRLTAVTAIEDAHPGLHFAGWAYRGVGIAHLATDALRIAGRIDGQLAG